MTRINGRLVVPRDPTPELGPCMRVLPARWRHAVEALFLTNGDRSKALEMAGYKSDNRESLHVQACRIFKDDRVRAAIAEELAKEIDISGPEMFGMARIIARNPGERAVDRLRAMGMFIDRSNPIMTKHQITVEHHLTDDERDIRHWHAMKKLGLPPDAFLARFGPNGIARVEALVLAEEAKRREIEGNTIEAEYEDVSEDAPEPAAVLVEQHSDFDEELL